jgi:hypothetical protein
MHEQVLYKKDPRNGKVRALKCKVTAPFDRNLSSLSSEKQKRPHNCDVSMVRFKSYGF